VRSVLFTLFLAVAAVPVVQPALAHADGTAPLRIRNARPAPVYFCVDNGGRGARNDKTMRDGRPGTLLPPGTAVRVPDSNLFDRVSIRCYRADGVEIYSKTLLLLPFGGERWEQVWTGARLVPDPR
jgi:hypothetical protein